MRRHLLPLVTALGLASLGACGGGSSTPATTVSFPANATIVKAVPSIRFDAAEYGPVPAGEVTIGYVNQDSVRHTLIIAKDGTKLPNFKLAVPKKGASDVGTVTLEAGTYTLLCDVPGHQNMKATLTVK
jgi:plastocyanin